MSDIDLPLAVRMMQDGYLMEIQDLKEKNEKLLELALDMKAIIWAYDEYTSDDGYPPALPLIEDRLREVGVEV